MKRSIAVLIVVLLGFCAAVMAWTPPVYNASVIAAFRAKKLVVPLPDMPFDPYTNGTVPIIPPFNDTTVCAVLYADAERSTYALQTFASPEEAVAAGAFVTHRYACGQCSTLFDLGAYMNFVNMTAPVKACGIDYWWSDALALQCLGALGFTPSCAAIWHYNTKNTAKHCWSSCLGCLAGCYPYNFPNGTLIPCIECDEEISGPIFKEFAGRTRRDSGLASAIWRPPQQIYQVEHYYY